MTLSLAADTPVEEIRRLRLELDHRLEQCRTAHQMAISLKRDNEALRKTVVSLEKRLKTLQGKQQSPVVPRRAIDPADQITQWLFDQEGDQPETDVPMNADTCSSRSHVF